MRIRWIIFKLLDKSTNRSTETEMITEIRARNHDIRLSCGFRDRRKYFGLDAGAIRYFNLPRVRKIRPVVFAVAVWGAVAKALIWEKPDVLLIDYFVNMIAAPLLLAGRALQKRTKIVLDIRTLPVDLKWYRWSIKLFFASLSLARMQCHGVTFITEAMREHCLSRIRLNRKKTGIWTSGVKPDLFDPDRFGKSGRNGDFKLFYHGGLSVSRGISSLIRAIRMLRERDCPAVLTLIGNCVDREVLLNIIRENKLEGICRIQAPLPYEEMPRMIKDCDLPVIPLPDFIGWGVSSPIKLFEYMAMGKAMVVTDIKAHRDVLGDADFAFYSRDSRADSLADAIERAYRMKDDLERLGRKARDLALAGHTWGRQAERLLQFVQSI